MNYRLIDVAMGAAPADMVIRGGMLANVLTREIYKADIAIADGLIAATGELEPNAVGPDTQVIDAEGLYLSPGFIDAHIHIESSMLTYSEFSRMTVAHGTTVVASDLMEVTIVSGVEGMKEVLEESKSSPVKLYYTVPTLLESGEGLQTIGAELNPDAFEELLDLPETVGLAEVLYPPILEKSPRMRALLALAAVKGKTAEGHAPALSGSGLNAYASAGIRSDHECTSATEALEKLRRGLRVLIREGNASADLAACLDIITKNKADSRRCAMVSDDIDMLHIYRKGHLDHKVRMAVAAGVDPMTALQMVTINPAESLKIDGLHGSIAPGMRADIVCLRDLASCAVERVIAAGKLAAQAGKTVYHPAKTAFSQGLYNTVKLVRPVTAEDMQIQVKPSAKTASVHVIGASPTSLLTEALTAVLPVCDGVVQPVPDDDILSIACVERYGRHGSIGKAFIHGFGLKTCAIATSVGHDHHNITVIGSDPADMALAVNRLGEIGGGLIVTEGGKLLHELPLPVCGLLTDQEGESAALTLEAIQNTLKQRGCLMDSPFMTLSFIPLIFIPDYGITDKGLVDVKLLQIIDPVISAE